MASSTVTAVVVIAAIFGVGLLVSVAIYLYIRRETERQHRRAAEARRREALRQQEAEQQRWRERRLRDVVLLLIERGDAAEGIPLAVQMPGRREVSCRRQVRQLHRDPEREHLEEELREEAEAALPAVVRATLHMPLSELLAHGRPVDAAPGPDIMQMLLDGQEPTQLSVSESESEGEWTDSVPASSSSSLPAGATLPVATTTTTATTHAAVNTTTTTSSVPPTPAPQPPLGEDAHAIWQEERRAAILHELQIERQRAQRRRRTAEEVYGEGYDYLINPCNYVVSSRHNDNDGNESSQRTSRRRSSNYHQHTTTHTHTYNNNSSITGNALDASTRTDMSQSLLRRLFATPRAVLPRHGRDRKASMLDATTTTTAMMMVADGATPTGTPRLIAILPNEPSNISWSDPHSQRVNIPY